MSDLYLVLRHRLDDVIEWVTLGRDVIHDARKAQGFSYETMGRKLNVAAKTWERYEKAGRVPRPMLPKVAEILDLEIEEPARTAISLPGREGEADPLAILQEEVSGMADQLGRIEQLLQQLAGPQSGSGEV